MYKLSRVWDVEITLRYEKGETLAEGLGNVFGNIKKDYC